MSNRYAPEDIKVNVKLKIASLWASFMLLYIYVDYFHLYMPGALQSIQAGKVYVFDITQWFALVVLSLAMAPIWMIFVSVVLPAKINRIVNVIVAALHIPYMLSNLAGESWVHLYVAAAVEVAMLCTIIYLALKWPTVPMPSGREG